MAYDYSVLFANIIAAVAGDGSFTERMHALIAHCEGQVPHQDWERMRQADYEADSGAFERWLATSLAEGGPGASFKGLWFGLKNPVVGGQPTADIYVCASTTFEPGSLNWAVDSIFYPESGYLNSKVLAAVYRLAYSSDAALRNDAEYPLALAYGAMAARTALESACLSGPFADLDGAAAGFDGGDFLFLGSFRDGRFCAKVEAG